MTIIFTPNYDQFGIIALNLTRVGNILIVIEIQTALSLRFLDCYPNFVWNHKISFNSIVRKIEYIRFYYIIKIYELLY